MRGDRAVSEVLGFLFLFAIILLVSFGGAFFGIDAIGDMTEGQDLQLAKDSMTTYRGHAYDIASGNAPYRSTAVKLTGGSLRYGENTTVRIEATDSGPGSNVTMTATSRTLVYDTGDSEVAFDSGGVFVQQDGGAAMIAQPAVRVDSNQSIFPLMNVSAPDDSGGVSGASTAYIASYRYNSTTQSMRFNTSNGTVLGTAEIAVESPRAPAWAAWLRDDPRFENVTVATAGDGPPTASATFTTERVFVRRTDIHVRYDV